MKLLHGDLDVEVVSGEDFEDRDNFLFHIVRGNWSDVWVSVMLGERDILTTEVKTNVINAVFGERVSIPVCERATHLEIVAWDKDNIISQEIGRGKIQLGDPEKSWNKDGPVFLDGGKSKVNMKIRYTPASQAKEEGMELPRTYYPVRKGGSVTFYQDAHFISVPGMINGGASAFEDIAKAMRGAKTFIYMAGWSVWTGTKMEKEGGTLGEILIKKAKEGLRVLLMIWNEPFSKGPCAGLMNTRDEDTDKFFDKTDVHVEKTRRKRTTPCKIKKKVIETIFTHHQKAIVMDDGKGSLIAFVGGLDLTSGRWDTPDHELYTTLKGDHRGDFHNGFADVQECQGPREPWHDVHARVTGGAAIDLLRNFEERWKKEIPKKTHLLLNIKEEDDDGDDDDGDDDGGDGTTWEVQVVRSIDDDSTLFSKGRVGDLERTEGRVIDRSMHRGAVRMIRRAQRFIYVESQFFIGSAQEWSQDQDSSATNLVPLEIAQKIVSKIRQGEDFRAYIVVPLMPEGNPCNPGHKCSINSIMHFQFLTMQMMYRKIGAALKEVGSDLHPRDYLIFLFLGKKESRERVNSSRVQTPKPWSTEWDWRLKARFPIYVHSKMMIADDETALVGSANLNERSLDASRDTEIAVIARQVHKGTKAAVTSGGGVAMFRRSLWAEHTWGLSEEVSALADPSSLAAIREVQTLADAALDAYVKGPSDEESRCRFMSYPLSINKDGTVKAPDDLDGLPDFGIPVEGCKGLIPPWASV